MFHTAHNMHPHFDGNCDKMQVKDGVNVNTGRFKWSFELLWLSSIQVLRTWIVAHLAGIIQRGSHARVQVVEGHRLQHIEVMGHLVLHGARTVNDVLWPNANESMLFLFSICSLQKTTLVDVKWQEEIYFVNVLTEVPLVQELKHFLRIKRERECGRVSARPVRRSDTTATQGGGVVTGVVEAECETLTSPMTRKRRVLGPNLALFSANFADKKSGFVHGEQ